MVLVLNGYGLVARGEQGIHPRDHLETCPSVVIGTFPRPDLLAAARFMSRARDAPEPLAIASIHQVTLDEAPGGERRAEIRLVARVLVRGEKADDRLGLRPPFLVGVDVVARALV